MATATATQTKKKIKFQPTEDRVLIEPHEAEETTAGGIILPDAAKEKATRGEVIAVGSGRILPNGKRVAMAVKSGDRVIYSKYGGSEIKLDGQEYKILQESEILAVID